MSVVLHQSTGWLLSIPSGKQTEQLKILHSQMLHGAGIFTYIWAIFMVNVGTYSIHGASGIDSWNFLWTPEKKNIGNFPVPDMFDDTKGMWGDIVRFKGNTLSRQSHDCKFVKMPTLFSRAQRMESRTSFPRAWVAASLTRWTGMYLPVPSYRDRHRSEPTSKPSCQRWNLPTTGR